MRAAAVTSTPSTLMLMASRSTPDSASLTCPSSQGRSSTIVTPSKGWIIVIRGGSESVNGGGEDDTISSSAARAGTARMTTKANRTVIASVARILPAQEQIRLELPQALSKVKLFSAFVAAFIPLFILNDHPPRQNQICQIQILDGSYPNRKSPWLRSRN